MLRKKQMMKYFREADEPLSDHEINTLRGGCIHLTRDYILDLVRDGKIRETDVQNHYEVIFKEEKS